MRTLACFTVALLLWTAPAAAQDVVARINFQPGGAATPSGWTADTGATFDAARGFGWDDTVRVQQRNYNPDVLLDTYAYVYNTTTGTWEYALANGTYLVTLVAGSPQWSATHTVVVEGTTVIDGVDTNKSFVEVEDHEVTITDGRLTVAIGGGPGRKTKICYLVIRTGGGAPAPDPDPGAENTAPQVSATASVTAGDAPLAVSFTGTAQDAEGPIATIAWDFGDGGTDSVLSPTHTYDTPGTYQAKLTVTDEGGLGASATVVVTVNAPNTPPQVSVTADIDVGDAPLTVGFNVTAEDAEGPIVGVAWEFGDGGTDTELSATHTYETPGVYQAKLTVTDEGGLSASATVLITVNEPPAPEPDPDAPPAGEVKINFQPASSALPDGYLADTGAIFDAGRGYGWQQGVSTKERDALADQRLDTYAYVYNNTSATWEYALPNGDYEVTLVCGSPRWNANHTAYLEGQLVIDRVDTGQAEFVEVTRRPVTVADGRLTVRIGGSNTGRKTKICYLIIHGDLEGTPAGFPTATLSATPTSGIVPLTVQFTGGGTDEGGSIVSYAWQFGDGQSSSAQSPEHTYTSTGAFTARLTVTDNDGLTAARTILINVNAEPPPPAPGVVTASVETDPVPGSGDAADDPCVWIHPTDRSLSTVIGTDKTGEFLLVYDLAGREMQRIPAHVNNVDIRYNFPLGGERVDLVCAGIMPRAIGAWKVNQATRLLEPVGDFPTNEQAHGFCMYLSPVTGDYYGIIIGKLGDLEQWRLFDDGTGRVTGELARAFVVGRGGESEGCVCDDIHGHLYVSEELVGIWKYGAEPNTGTTRTLVDSAVTGAIRRDVEGLTIYYRNDGTGYLIASSQARGEYCVYEREGDNNHLFTFQIKTGVVDKATDTDGIDVTNVYLGPAFPFGLFVVQDGSNDGQRQNFKLVPWERIADAATPHLAIDTSWDPRAVGR